MTSLVAYDASAALLGIPDDPAPVVVPFAPPPEAVVPRTSQLRNHTSPPPSNLDALPGAPGQRPVQERSKPVTEPPVPSIGIPSDAPPGTPDDTVTAKNLLQSAKVAVSSRQRNKAVDLIDRAQVRLLSRSVALNRTMDQISDTTVDGLTQAKQAILAGDVPRALSLIDQALTSAP